MNKDMNKQIVVVGSLNMDMVVQVDRRPGIGETILGRRFFTSPGGKGANQAYAAARLGGSVFMVGKTGADMFGEQLLRHLKEAGVQTEGIAACEEESSGVACITIDAQGENNIIVVPGANHRLTAEDIRQNEARIQSGGLLVVQLEIPMEAVLEAVRLAHHHRVPVLLDPAPACPLPDELLGMVHYITPNESEMQQLTGKKVHDPETAFQAAEELLARGVRIVFAKRGENGVAVLSRSERFHMPGFRVNAVDTTAAGDTFAGALAVALTEGKSLSEAVRFANAASALSVTRYGAQSSMPDRSETEAFLNEHAGGMNP